METNIILLLVACLFFCIYIFVGFIKDLKKKVEHIDHLIRIIENLQNEKRKN